MKAESHGGSDPTSIGAESRALWKRIGGRPPRTSFGDTSWTNIHAAPSNAVLTNHSESRPAARQPHRSEFGFEEDQSPPGPERPDGGIDQEAIATAISARFTSHWIVLAIR
jgi:hypothetical protein